MKSVELHIGLSPCPNDTFILYGLLNGKIDTGELNFIPHYADIEDLNHRAMQHEMDVMKISFHTLKFIDDTYEILDCGSALGFGNGPLLVGKKNTFEKPSDEIKIAVPGIHTTAVLLLNFFYPEMKNLIPMHFRSIADAVLAGDAEAGLIIHESRFTFENRGLVKIDDLGEHWEKHSGLPVPLGGFVIKRNLPEEVKQKVNQLMRESLLFSNSHSEEAMPWILSLAEEQDEEVVRKHISLYVNDYTLSLGDKGREAIYRLLSTSFKQ
ncbi:MAG: 1,4-dihydroxy-6-naphthoate synthase [Bacteroidota bacterium]